MFASTGQAYQAYKLLGMFIIRSTIHSFGGYWSELFFLLRIVFFCLLLDNRQRL
jgi:hypothetical protein